MAYKVIIPRLTERDADEAVQWYEEQQPGLGIRFYQLLLGKLEELKDHPHYFSFIYAEYRRITIDPFPFSIVYKIIDNDVLILAIFHQSQDPVKLTSRLT
jgi:plasmid stabilization system protein ParE